MLGFSKHVEAIASVKMLYGYSLGRVCICVCVCVCVCARASACVRKIGFGTRNNPTTTGQTSTLPR